LEKRCRTLGDVNQGLGGMQEKIRDAYPLLMLEYVKLIIGQGIGTGVKRF
jgi:hypothetical protein